MRRLLKNVVNDLGFDINKRRYPKRFDLIYERNKDFTMTPKRDYYENLFLVEKMVRNIEGDIVECGVWRGGMSAGIAELLGKNRRYFLFDSFEGLPKAKEIDGEAALKWQKNPHGDFYFDNCKAEMGFANKVMANTGCEFKLIKGWFEESLPLFDDSNTIGLLRLDGDWYESIYSSLKYLYTKVVKGGLIIIDDYYSWDGCSRAVHDYLSGISSLSRIRSTEQGICYIIKQD